MLQFLNKSKFHTNCAFPIDCNHLSSILDFPPYHTPARDVYSISLCPPTKASQPQSGVSHAGANIVFQQPLGGVSCRLCNVFVFRQFRTRIAGMPLCLTPSHSPGPRKDKSILAMVKPSSFSRNAFNRATACADKLREYKRIQVPGLSPRPTPAA